jgi:agmatinase
MERTYAGIPEEFATPEAQIYLFNVPYDGTSTWGKGADKGFDAFLFASENMELYDIETRSEVYRCGVYLDSPVTEASSPEAMTEAVYAKTNQILDKRKFFTMFGGEHSVSIGAIRAHTQRVQNLSVLQLDAHADLRPEFHGSQCNHACAVHEAQHTTNLIQVGIRSMDISEEEHMKRKNVFFAHDILDGDDDWIHKVIDKLTDDVYITIDLDVFDSSLMPSTGTPEPGGLDWHTVTRLLKKVCKKKRVVGFDIVELAPIDGLDAPNFVAAKLYYKLLSYVFENK